MYRKQVSLSGITPTTGIRSSIPYLIAASKLLDLHAAGLKVAVGFGGGLEGKNG